MPNLDVLERDTKESTMLRNSNESSIESQTNAESGLDVDMGEEIGLASDNSLKVLIFPIKISIVIFYYNLILAFYI
jgi:hypothetical protein